MRRCLHDRERLWFVLVGLWMAIAHVVLGVALCVTIIGIPLGLANFNWRPWLSLRWEGDRALE